MYKKSILYGTVSKFKEVSTTQNLFEYIMIFQNHSKSFLIIYLILTMPQEYDIGE